MSNYIMLPGSTENDGGIITVGTCKEDYSDVIYLRGTLTEWFGDAPIETTIGERIQVIREKLHIGQSVDVEVISF